MVKRRRRTCKSRADDITTRQKVRWRNYVRHPHTRTQMDNNKEKKTWTHNVHTHTRARQRADSHTHRIFVEQSKTFCLRKSSSSSPISIIITFRVHETLNETKGITYFHTNVLRRAGSSSLIYTIYKHIFFHLSLSLSLSPFDAKPKWIICEWIGKQK